jgi:hypothetical protein
MFFKTDKKDFRKQTSSQNFLPLLILFYFLSLLTIGYRWVSTTTMDNENYQFIHKCIVPTYHFQKSLRRLPIPKLELTAQRYLAAVEAVCSEKQINEAKVTVDELLKGQGPGNRSFSYIFNRIF